MAGSSNLPDAIARIQDYEYLYASNTNVSNFVSVKLSGYGNYDLWKTQMLCLMEAHEMIWLVDDTPKDLSKKINKKYDSLLKGWIFGSVSEDVLRIVVNPTYSAKHVWEKLISSFDPTMSSKKERHANSTPATVDTAAKTNNNMALGETSTNKEGIESEKSDGNGEEATQIETKDSALTKEDTITKTEDNTTAFGETAIKDEGDDSEVIGEDDTKKGTKDSEATKVDKAREIEAENSYSENKKLRELILDKRYWAVYKELESRNAFTEKIDSDGNTLLHIIATVGYTTIAEKLIKSHKNLLHIKNNEGKTALDKAYENMHLDIIAYLEGSEKDDEICKKGAETETKDLPQLIADADWYAVYLKSTQLSEEINSDGNTLLHIAAEIGDYNLMSAILWREPDYDWTNIKNKHGSTVLHIAAIAGNTNGAELLVKHNKRLLEIQDNEGRTPLDRASENGNFNIARYLKEAANEGAKRVTNKNKLQQLIEDQDWVGVYLELGEREALTEKINSNGNTLLHKAVEIGNDMLISEMLKPHDRLYRRFYFSLDDLHLTNIKNYDGSTALHIAAIVGNTSAAKILIMRDKRLLDIPDNDGKTPMDKANETGHLKTISYLRKATDFQKLIVDGDWLKVYTKLRKRNALLETIDGDGNTLLHKVIEISRNDVVNKILSHIPGYYLTDMKSYNGSTVLHIAAIVGNTDAAVLLVKHGTQLLDIPDNEGKTPLDKANENGHHNTIAYLQEAAQKPAETKELRQLIGDGDWLKVYAKLKKKNALTENIDSEGNTLLHKAVEISRNDLVKRILPRIRSHDLTEIKNSNGSTVLHIAAIVGNTDAAVLLVKHDRQLLDIRDNEDQTPMDKANGNRHLKNTIAKLDQAAKITEANELRQLVVDGDWYEVIVKLYKRNALQEKINSNGNTLLHVLVGMGDEFLINATLWRISNHDLTTIKNAEGSTVLHIAAIVGNTNAAKILVKRKKDLLYTKDNEGKTPLDKAYENMHLDTIAYLLEAIEEHEDGKEEGQEASTVHPRKKKDADVEIGVDLLANAISAKRYDVALNLIGRYPEYAVFNDNVLMAMARTFPTGLDYGERLIYPNLDNTSERIVGRTRKFFNSLVELSSDLKKGMWSFLRCEFGILRSVALAFLVTIYVLYAMGYWIYKFIPLFLLMVYFPFFVIYLLLWTAAARVVPLVRNIEQKKKEYRKAKEVLELVLKTIIDERPDSSPDLYTAPILEAACQDAYEVVDQILGRWPEAIHCEDKNGYDIIQLATIHRSERVYNMIYIIGERKMIYRTIQDSSDNNMLHLVGRLAPSNKLKRRTGAALQLQRELQWRQEVEKLVFPTFVTKENIFKETPEMVFTKEHETLVKEGENWIKTVAESCSITAALITTIVFAAAITVPGGSNQDTGIPVFTKKAAFTLFAIADAISLFSSATALLVFLSILTARFAEQDFLVRLPRRLIIGLCTLLISTTAMMVAFSATLFLVFAQQKLWVIAPICAFAVLPIAFFFVLQFPLILDLIQSTYIFKFGKNDDESSKFAQNNIQFNFR